MARTDTNNPNLSFFRVRPCISVTSIYPCWTALLSATHGGRGFTLIERVTDGTDRHGQSKFVFLPCSSAYFRDEHLSVLDRVVIRDSCR
jgi:hypothetical protein